MQSYFQERLTKPIILWYTAEGGAENSTLQKGREKERHVGSSNVGVFSP